MWPKVEQLGDYIFTEGEFDVVRSIVPASTVPTMRVLKNRRAPVTAQRCKGCHAEVPEAEQLVSTVGIICVDCDELFLEQGSSAPVPALPKCGRCKLGVWPGDEKLVAFVDKKTGQQRIFTVHATCP